MAGEVGMKLKLAFGFSTAKIKPVKIYPLQVTLSTLLFIGTFSNSILNKKEPNNNKYNSGLCVFMPKFAYLSQPYNETSIIIVCNSKNLIQ